MTFDTGSDALNAALDRLRAWCKIDEVDLDLPPEITDVLIASGRAPAERTCRVCGCHDTNPGDGDCPGGCYWVAQDLCSRCEIVLA